MGLFGRSTAGRGRLDEQLSGSDPVTCDRYSTLPWHDIGLSALADAEVRRLAVTRHSVIVDKACAGATVADRLRLLGRAVGEEYSGLRKGDGTALGRE